MNIEQFWAIVERVHAAASNDMAMKCTLLAGELRQLSPDEIRSFGGHFGDCFMRAYNWDIWGAAFVISDGCSDDGFMDFRSTLISLGCKPFEAALIDADGLSQFDINPDWSHYEGYQYVSHQVYKEIGGKDLECDCLECQPGKKKIRPKAPAGIPFVEWEMSSRFPKLVAKYGFKDSAWLDLKKQKETSEFNLQAARRTADLMLKTGMVASCGLIPPFRIVAQLLKSGQISQSVGNGLSWEPYILEEVQYWSTVMMLEKMVPDEKAIRPELTNIQLALDLKCPDVGNFDDWMESLKKRGLV